MSFRSLNKWKKVKMKQDCHHINNIKGQGLITDQFHVYNQPVTT